MPERKKPAWLTQRIARAAPCLFLTLLVLILFADVLFLPGDKVPSARYGDINHYFSTARAFGFREISHGNLPLWDPHIFSGTPFVATFQSALLYPPNLVYAVLPLAKAISLDLALHVLLFGLFTFAWARSRSIGPAGAAFAGAAAMFSGAFFYRVAAGHVTVIDGFAWMPLILLAVDKLLRQPSLAWTMAGIFAATMQILAGMPQVVFITFVTAGLLCVFQPMRWIKKPATLAALGSLGVFPVLLAAAQLFTSFQALQYSKSHGGGSYEFSTAHSFPPANLLTLLVPQAYGDQITSFYWGSSHVWEVTSCLGITGLILAILGMIYGPGRRNAPLYGVASVLVLLALGRYTPFYQIVYRFIPGFSLFRAPARFLIPCSVILGVFSGNGVDALLQGKGRPRLFCSMSIVLAGLLAGGASWVNHESQLQDLLNSAWRSIVEANYGFEVTSTDTLRAAAGQMTPRLLLAAGISALLALLFLILRRRAKMGGILIVVLGLVELFFFAATTRSSFRLSDQTTSEFKAAVAKLGDARLFEDPYQLNHAYVAGGLNVWGYEPMIQERYVEFIARAMHVKQPMSMAGRDPAFLAGATFGRLLRVVRMQAYSHDRYMVPVVWDKPPLPRFFLVNSCSVFERDKVLDAMESPGFDPLWQVLLEEDPVPSPDPSGKYGTVSVVEQSSDHFILDVNAPSPAILINTDAYAPGWRATPVTPGPQQSYSVMPADCAIRAVPLAAGHHLLRLEYAPSGFSIGIWVSLISAAACLAAVAFCLRRMLTASPAKGGSVGRGT